jgi:hypothetical protein
VRELVSPSVDCVCNYHEKRGYLTFSFRPIQMCPDLTYLSTPPMVTTQGNNVARTSCSRNHEARRSGE